MITAKLIPYSTPHMDPYLIPMSTVSYGLQHINCIIQDQGLGNVYLGDVIAITRPDYLISNNIKAVLTCAEQVDIVPCIQNKNWKKIPLKDSLDFNIMKYFDQCYQFIEKHRNEKKNILIHCHAGISRSSTIIIAYLMKKNNKKLEQCLKIVKAKRPRIKPNQNFMKQLLQFQTLLYNSKDTDQNRIITSSKQNQNLQKKQKLKWYHNNNNFNVQYPKNYNLKKINHKTQHSIIIQQQNLKSTTPKNIQFNDQPNPEQQQFLQKNRLSLPQNFVFKRQIIMNYPANIKDKKSHITNKISLKSQYRKHAIKTQYTLSNQNTIKSSPNIKNYDWMFHSRH